MSMESVCRGISDSAGSSLSVSFMVWVDVWRRLETELPNWCLPENPYIRQTSAHNYSEQSQLCVIVMCGRGRGLNVFDTDSLSVIP